jgi:hypothetical protein
MAGSSGRAPTQHKETQVEVEVAVEAAADVELDDFWLHVGMHGFAGESAREGQTPM